MGRLKKEIPTNAREDTGLALERTARAFSKRRATRKQLVGAALRYARAVAEDDGGHPLPKGAGKGHRRERTEVVDRGEE